MPISLSQLSIKTRIETKNISREAGVTVYVWVSYPLKQGLKLNDADGRRAIEVGLSQLSIKTRIETRHSVTPQTFEWGLSQLSIKTRIETDAENPEGEKVAPFESAIH